MINHPLVADCEQTCGACPEQYSGHLVDGREFYYRYRHGVAGLGVSSDIRPHTRGHVDEGTAISDGDDGVFDSPEQRDAVFALLLDRVQRRGY